MSHIMDLIVFPIIVLIMASTIITANVNKMYDLETLRTAGEADTVHQFSETVALDALDVYLDKNLASEGILYIPSQNVEACESYFKNIVASLYRESTSGRGTIINQFLDYELYQGAYTVETTGSGNFEVTKKRQTPAQRPYIKCTIKGTVKTATSNETEAGEMRKTDFTIDVFAYATHIEGGM